jgi:UDP-glucose 4-epimerase
MKKILLTGGVGFIGSHIAVALREAGYEPVIIDNYSNSDRSIPNKLSKLTGTYETVLEIDCRDLASIKLALEPLGKIEGIIHLAAFKAVGESVANPLKYYDNNLGAMTSILRLAAELDIPNFVFSSSCTVYGAPEVTEVHEQTPFGETPSPYGFSKQICERMMREVSEIQRDKAFISLRYFNPIGAHPTGQIGELPLGKPNNLVPYLTQTAAGIRDLITVFGTDYETPDGTCIRDYIHVYDLARAHVAALDFSIRSSRPGYEVFNIGTGKGHSVLEIIHTFKDVNGVDFNVKLGDRRPGDVAAIYANVDKAKKHLDWSPRYTMADALRHAWKWQQNLVLHSS